MSGVAPQWNGLSLPAIPATLSDAETQQVLAILRNAQTRARPYDGDFGAPWLLSAFDSPLWHTTHRGREEYINGQWRHTVDVNWDQVLPNGARLLDPEYAALLTTLKKLAVLLRSGYVGRALAPAVWRPAVISLLSVARWLVLHEARYQPAKYGFALLDQNGLNLLLSQIARGGWSEAYQIPQRLLSAWYAQAVGGACPQAFVDQPYALPSDVRETLTAWLTTQSCYSTIDRGAHRGRRCLRRPKLASQVHASLTLLRASDRVSAFCRQFEPDFLGSPLLLTTSLHTEYPDHLTPLREDVAREPASIKTLEDVVRTIGRLLSAHRHLPLALPAPDGLSVTTAFDWAKRRAKPGGHSAFIPITTGLTYLNEAIRWIHCYGDAIVDDYVATIAHIEFSEWNTLKADVRTAAIDHAFAAAEGTSRLVQHRGDTRPVRDALGIGRFDRRNGTVDFDALRQAPTLAEALDVLIGACILCIGLLKPSRESELTHLTRECLTQRHDGYYLRFELGKSNAGEAYQSRDKPIPVITAHAIRLLQRLGGGLSAAFGESRKRKDYLFYLPSSSLGGALIAHPAVLNDRLDRFCDYIGLPPDALGRRWYVRVHEMRKWFLLLLFWAGRFDVLDAARWIAGHVKADHTYAYIEQHFPGEELPGIEAEYSIDRLRRWDRARRECDPESGPSGEPGLEALHERVCRHFNTASLVMVPDVEWMDYVTALRACGGFALHPHSIDGWNESGERQASLQVSFVLAESIT